MIKIVECDFSDIVHRQAFVSLIEAYMADEMGGYETMTEKVRNSLAEAIASHQNARVFLASKDDVFVGVATCFINISTFKAKPYYNIHDIAVLHAFRGKGIGKTLLTHIIDDARQRGFCKITLEVRHDNLSAQMLYKSLGFEDTDPAMYFWVKTI
jgi:ribosomal protein S18 acetylase RimI-like enzyme